MRTINDEEFIIPVYTGQYSSLNIIQTLALKISCRTLHVTRDYVQKDCKKNPNPAFESDSLEFNNPMSRLMLAVGRQANELH